MAARARATGRVPREGATRGKDQHLVGRPEHRVGARRQRIRRRSLRPPAVPRFLRALRRARSRGRESGSRWRRPCSSSPSQAYPTSTRETSSGRSTSSTPTTAARSTGSSGARSCASSPTAKRPPARPPSSTSPGRPSSSAQDAPTSFTGGAYQPLDAGPGICAYLRGDDVLVAVAVDAGELRSSPGRASSMRSAPTSESGSSNAHRPSSTKTRLIGDQIRASEVAGVRVIEIAGLENISARQ